MASLLLPLQRRAAATLSRRQALIPRSLTSPLLRRLSEKKPSVSEAPKARQPIPRSLTSPLPPPAEIPGAVLKATGRLLSLSATWSVRLVRWSAEGVWICFTDPPRARKTLAHFWELTKHELHHYWLGSKLFVTEVSTSTALVRKVSNGEVLTWRERQQLRRTMGDLLRMVPFAIIVIIPLAEFSLPVLLRLFPNMLPSQFEKKEYRQEVYKKNLNSRLELHGILQEIVQDRLAAAASAGADAPSATEMLKRIDDVRAGKALPLEAIVGVAQLFRDDVTIENVPRAQLAAVAKYLQLSPFTPEPLLRFQLRMKLRAIKEDDALLAKEGTAHLTPDELLAACEARGMRAAGLAGGDAEYRQQLDDWLTLSVGQQVPAVLLVLSRALMLASGGGGGAQAPVAHGSSLGADVSGSSIPESTVVSAQALAETVATMDAATVQEVVAAQVNPASSAAAEPEDKTAELQLRLDSIESQNEVIEEEREVLKSLKESELDSDATTGSSARAVGGDGDPSGAAATAAPDTTADSAAAAAAAQLEAIRQAALSATVAREKLLLSRIKEVQARIAASLEAAAVAAATTVAHPSGEGDAAAPASPPSGTAAAASAPVEVVPAAAPAPVDRGVSFLTARLNSMLSVLEQDIVRAEQGLSHALRVADSDRDGEVSEAELRDALARLGGPNAGEAAAALIHRLDSDGDGDVTVEALERYLDKFSAVLARAEERRTDAEGGSNGPAAPPSAA